MHGTFIFVLDRGFVVVGEAELSSDLEFHWHLPRSATIRVWGTTRGLAELCDGPTPETVVDAVIQRTTPFRSVLDIYHLTEKGTRKWREILSR